MSMRVVVQQDISSSEKVAPAPTSAHQEMRVRGNGETVVVYMHNIRIES